MFGTDATGAPYYCSSGHVWTAMGGSSPFLTAKNDSGGSAYPSYIVLPENANDHAVLQYYGLAGNGTGPAYTEATPGQSLPNKCFYNLSGSLISSYGITCPNAITLNGPDIQVY